MSESRKVAVVTGASSGIGYAITKELISNNYKVYACSRTLDGLTPLTSKYPPTVIEPYKIDITNLEEIKNFKDYLAKELVDKKLDLLYNNAGQSCTFPALDVSNEAIEQCFKVNVFGHMNMTKQLSQFLINAKGTIVFTGSTAGIISFPFGSVYSASKAAIHSYARGLHLELKPFGVRVINVVTGGVDTNIADTRPLPNDSIFNFKEGQDSFRYRQLMAKNHHPMPADVYAKKILRDIMSDHDPVDLYRGKMASILSWISLFIPYWLLEFGLIKKFKLGRVFDAVANAKKTN